MVSSIKDSIIDPEEGGASSEQRENSSPNPDHASSSGKSISEQQNSSFLYSSYVRSTADEVSETASSVINKGYDEGEKELEQRLPPKMSPSVENSTKELKVSSSEKVWSDELPSFLSSASEISTINDEKQPEINNVESDPIAEDTKPPPLAGANVMNVILVAAECAPWSKTGFLHDIRMEKSFVVCVFLYRI